MGSITVFLSLSGMLIMALLGTLLETARIGLCANHLERSLVNATEGLLSEYNLPLYQNYGLFYIESGGDSYESVINRYLSKSLEPQGKGTTNFLKQQMEKLNIVNREYLGDNKAMPLQKEIDAMMLRKLGKEKLKEFLVKSKNITDTENQATAIEKEVEQQEKEAECDVELLKLIKLIDGVVVSKGKVSCEKEFIKMFCTKKKKAQDFGITEKCVWDAMKKKIYQIPKEKSEISELEDMVSEVLKIIKEAISIRDTLKKKVKNVSVEKEKRSMNSILISMNVLEGNQSILLEVQKELQKDDCEWQKVLSLMKKYDTSTIQFDYTGVTEKGGGDSPLDSLGSAWSKGILGLVWPSAEKLSNKSIKKPDKYAELYEETSEETEDMSERVSNFSENEEVELSGVLGDIGSYGMDEFCMDKYIQSYFRSYAKKDSKWKTCLDYQWEYIIAGNETDEENLASVLNRILLTRTVINFAAIMQSGSMKKEAYTAALAVVGFTGMEFLVRLMQTLIIITWSFVESLVDISGMLQNRDVPVVKKSQDVLTSFSEIFLITNSNITSRAKRLKKETKNSFGYKEYVCLFLAMTDQSLRRYRIMDLIENDMRANSYEKFNLGTMVYSITVEAETAVPTYFFHLPTVENMLKRKISSYPCKRKIRVGYL